MTRIRTPTGERDCARRRLAERLIGQASLGLLAARLAVQQVELEVRRQELRDATARAGMAEGMAAELARAIAAGRVQFTGAGVPHATTH